MKNSKTTFLRFVSAYLSIILLTALPLPIYVALNRAVHDNLLIHFKSRPNAAHELEATEDLLLHTRAMSIMILCFPVCITTTLHELIASSCFCTTCQLQERMKLRLPQHRRHPDGLLQPTIRLCVDAAVFSEPAPVLPGDSIQLPPLLATATG